MKVTVYQTHKNLRIMLGIRTEWRSDVGTPNAVSAVFTCQVPGKHL